MDIVSYLTEILKTRKTIGIEGLGTLYKKKIPGKYDAIKHAFIPPSYHIDFTHEVKDDAALANHIAADRNISLESANYYISEFVEQIRTQIADHQEAHLGQIGKFRLQNDQLVLIPAESSTFESEFFGLPTLTVRDNVQHVQEISPPVEEETLAEIEEENRLEEENPGTQTDSAPDVDHHVIYNADMAVESAASDDTRVSHETYLDDSEDVEPEKTTPFFIKFLLVLIVIVAAGAVAYFINPKFFDKYIQQNFETEPSRQIPVVPKDSLKDTKQRDSLPDSVSKNNDLVSLARDSSVIDSTKRYYEVIGTSMTTRKAADQYIARVASRGIKASIAKMPGKRFNVSLGTFMNPKDAKKAQDSLRVALKDRGIYVQQIKPKK